MRIRLKDGHVLTVRDGAPEDEIQRKIEAYYKSQRKTDVASAVNRGLAKGAAATPNLLAGATGLIDSLIPGKQKSLEAVEANLRESAQTWEDFGPGGESDTLVEKIFEGIGRAPGELATIVPFGATALPLRGVAGLGAAMARPALALGTHSAVMHGGEGLRESAAHGLRGAAEGAAFGVAGRWAHKLVPEVSTLGKNLARRAVHGGLAGGIVGGAAAAEGQSTEDVVASATVMGLLGAALPSSKYKKTRAELLEDLKLEVDQKLKSGEITPKEAEVMIETAPNELVLPEPTKFDPDKIGRGSFIESDLTAAGEASRRIPQLTKAGQNFYSHPELRQHYAESQKRQEFAPRSNEDVIRRAHTELITDAEGNIVFAPENADAAMYFLENSTAKHAAIGTALRQKVRAAKLQNDPAHPELMEQYEAHLATAPAQMMAARGLESSVANAMRIVATARRGQPDWMKAAKVLEKKGIFDGDMKFKNDVKDILELSEGNPELQARIAKAFDTPALWDYFQEYWINGLLSGFPTQAVNLGSNQMMLGADMLEKKAALYAETKIAPVLKGGGRGKKLAKWAADGEWDADNRGLRASLGPALKVAGKMIWDENYDVAADYPQWASLQRYGIGKLGRRSHVIGGLPGKVIRFPSRALGAMDMYNKIIAGERYAHSSAYRIAAKEVMDGKLKQSEIPARKAELLGQGDKPVDRRVLDSMQKNAARLTFTEELEGGIATFAKLRDVEIGGVKPGVVLVPFLGTPWHVIRQSIKRSPLNVVNSLKRWKQYKSGEMTPQQFFQEVAATTIGTAVTASLVAFAKMGYLTGGGPTNPADRAMKMASGWKPYAFKIPYAEGENAYISMQRFEPLGTILGMAGDIAEMGDADDKYGKMTAAIKDNLTNKTFLMGIENFAAFMHKPEQFGGMWTRQMVGSLVPTMLAKGAQAVDPYARMVDPVGATSGVPDAILYRTPFLSQILPKKYTALGESAERWSFAPATLDTTAGKVIRGVAALTSPGPASVQTSDQAVEAEMSRLSAYEGMPPSMPSKKKKMRLRGVDGVEVELNEDEYEIYSRYHLMAKRQLTKVISGPRWVSIPDGMKAVMMRKIYDKYRRIATKQVNNNIRRRTSVGE